MNPTSTMPIVEGQRSKVVGRGSRRDGPLSTFDSQPSILAPRPSTFVRVLVWAVIGLGVIAPRVHAADPAVWQLTPYRIQVVVAGESFFGSPVAAGAFRAALAAQLEAIVGAAWELTVAEPPPALRWARIESLETLAAENLLPPKTDFDKIIVLVVTAEKGTLQAGARELDVRTLRFGPVIVRTVWQRSKLCDAAGDAVLEAFTPLASIDSVNYKKQEALLRLKAAGLPPRDKNLVFVRPGTLFLPIIRLNDRSGNPKVITPVTWTFLVAKAVSPEQVLCQMFTGMQQPLYARRRGRLEQLALAVHPLQGTTTLQVRARSEPKPPLVGYEIYEQVPGVKALKYFGRTDHRGQIVIPCGETPLRIFMVKNGDRLLARLPLAPGLEPTLTAEIANDDARLQAEGALSDLVDELTDTVGRRQVLAARIQACLKNGELNKAEQLLRDLRALPDAQQFITRLAEEKKRLLGNNPSLQKQIEAQLTDTQKLIDKHLKPRITEELAKQLRTAQAGGKREAEGKKKGNP